MSLAAMRAYAKARKLPVDVERQPTGDGRVLVRIWSEVDGERLMTDAVVPLADADRTVNELADRFLFWWREDERR